MDLMDIQPPKRRPVVPKRPVRPVVQSQPRPKISLDSVRQVRQDAQQRNRPMEQIWSDPIPEEIPSRSQPESAPQFAADEPQVQAHARLQPAQPAPAYELAPEPSPAQAPVAMQAEPLPKPKKPKQQKHHLRLLLVSVFGLLVLGAAGTAGRLWYVRNQQPQYVGSKFVADLQADKPSAAYGLVSGAFKTATSEAALATVFKQGTSHLQGPYIISDQITPTKANPTNATYVYKVITPNNGAEYVRVILQKSSKWQVSSFRATNEVLTAQVAN